MVNYANLSNECLVEKRNKYFAEIIEYEAIVLSTNSQLYLLYLASMIGKRRSKIRAINAELALRQIEEGK